MRYPIRGHFEEYIIGLMEQRHTVGFVCKEEERLLYRFSEFCNLHFPNETELTEQIVKKWSQNPNNYKNAYQSYRMAAVRRLGVYMIGMGRSAYILPTEFYPSHDPKYKTRIYSKEELARIFYCADNRTPIKMSPCLHLIVPVVIRLLYCCGLRPSEARKLKMEHIDLDKGEFRVIASKGLKDRLIIMSDDMAELCRKYNAKIGAMYPERIYFFHCCYSDKNYGKTWIQEIFKSLLEDANIDTSSTFSKPRLYDLRHTFATHCLQKWIDKGKDVNAKLLYLSAYMGHNDVTNTAYYIHLVHSEFSERSKSSTLWYSDFAKEASCEY